jgi:acetyl-CoA C-acetyltransferase
MFRRAIKPETYHKAGMVSAPLNMFDVAPNADGAAAAVLVNPDRLAGVFPQPLVRVAGSSVATDTLALHDRPDPLVLNAAYQSVARACEQAGLALEDMDLFELHDAYSIYSALALEAAGFTERGQGWKLAQNGGITLTGRLPITTFGGAKARGNPGGATGMYQIVEATLQLREAAGANQVSGANRALVQCLGGPASTVVTHILEKG